MPGTPSTTKMRGTFSMHTHCPRCGRELGRTTVELFGRQVEVTCYGSCGCEESKLDGEDVGQEERRYAIAGIPVKYTRRQVDVGGAQASVYDGSSLYVYGPNGTGKSTYIANVAKLLCDMGRTVLFRNSKLLTEEIKATFDTGDQEILERCYGVDVLFLDDLGKEQPTDYVLSMLYALVEMRYADMKPTVIASNFARDELLTRWAQVDEATAVAIVSRLCDGVRTVRMDGRDWRVA